MFLFLRIKSNHFISLNKSHIFSVTIYFVFGVWLTPCLFNVSTFSQGTNKSRRCEYNHEIIIHRWDIL